MSLQECIPIKFLSKIFLISAQDQSINQWNFQLELPKILIARMQLVVLNEVQVKLLFLNKSYAILVRKCFQLIHILTLLLLFLSVPHAWQKKKKHAWRTSSETSESVGEMTSNASVSMQTQAQHVTLMTGSKTLLGERRKMDPLT